MNPAPRPVPSLRRDVLFALAFLATASVLTLLSPDYFEPGQRLLGVMAGLVVMYYANAVPKMLKPLATLKNPARHQALQRFIGWALLLGGLGYALAFLLAPFRYTVPIAIALLGSSLIIATARCFRVRRLS